MPTFVGMVFYNPPNKPLIYTPSANNNPKIVFALPVAAIAGIIVCGVSFLLNRRTALIGNGADIKTSNHKREPYGLNNAK